VPALARKDRLCVLHSKSVTEVQERLLRGLRDDEPMIGGRPPFGHASCPVCRVESAQSTDAVLSKLTAGTRTVSHTVTADDPDANYQAQSERVAARLAARRAAEKEEARRIEPALAKMDKERPTMIELDHSRPGPERQRAYDRHMKAINGGRRSWRGSDVTVLVPEDGMDFDSAMNSARAAKNAVLATASESARRNPTSTEAVHNDV
jgi:hypothetical protein